MTAAATTIYCEVCRLPHRAHVTTCEECGHQLGTAPDLEALRRELPKLRRNAALGLAAFFGFIALTYAAFRVGFFYAPGFLAWAVYSIYKHQLLAGRLRKHDDPERR